ncbi:MAG TPA: hypothetical protein PLO41_14475 [Rubrivivax sp.]|nr:hypothetical protein [Rubrivivax sp.]
MSEKDEAEGGTSNASQPGTSAPEQDTQSLSLDLTTTEGKGWEVGVEAAKQTVESAGGKLGEPASIETRESSTFEDVYSPQDKARDDTRQTIALWLIGLFCTIVVLCFTALFMIGLRSKEGFDQQFFTNLKTLLDVLVGPVITLLSAAVGFYFGNQQALVNAAAKAGTTGQSAGATSVTK